MDVDIEAKIPRLKKEASAHGIRQITRLGQITYQAVRSVGDKMVVKDVIARYLTAETRPARASMDSKGKTQSIAITPRTTNSSTKQCITVDGRKIHTFQVTPKKKRVGLFKGEIWVDAETDLPVREIGRFVKNPSVFLKKVDFVREYEIRAGWPCRSGSRVVWTRAWWAGGAGLPL